MLTMGWLATASWSFLHRTARHPTLSHIKVMTLRLWRTASCRPSNERGMGRMALLVNAFSGKPEDWRQLLAAELPGEEVRFWPEAGDRADIEVAAVAVLPHGTLKTFPNLKMIVSLLAG